MKEKKVCWTCRFCKMDIRDGDPYCLLRVKGGKCYAYSSWESQEDVLDKIREEIAELDNKVCQQFLIEDVDKEAHHAYQDCLDIIDKYKAESKEK